MDRLRRIAVTIAGVVSGLLAGCAGGLMGEQARQAERAGQYHRAYDLYCQAADVNPGSRMVGMAIARVAPQAAMYWEDEAHRAVDRGDHLSAWRLFMRVLAIRPDHPSAPHLIRRLERNHTEQIAAAQTAWLRRGSKALASSTTRLALGDRGRPKQSSGSVRGSDSGRASPSARAPARPALTAGTGAGRTDSASPAERPRPALQVGRGVVSKGGAKRLVVASGNSPVSAGTGSRRPVGRSARVEDGSDQAGRVKHTGRMGAAGRPAAPGLRPMPTSRGRVGGASSRPVVRASDYGTARGRAVERSRSGTVGGWGSPFQFLVVRTLSKKDRRFPKKAEVIDGLIIEVRDTDDDPDADFNVYLGRKRIGKFKGKAIGEPCPVYGRSGRRYEVVLLAIVDKRRTIRFGIRSARGRRVR